MKFTYATDARPVDGFTIRRGIHRGGFGEVYYAVSDAGKEVALKLLTHDLDTELRGIRQCLNLKHPNLITIFDVKHDRDGDHWVVMEYVNGSNLEEILTAFPSGLPFSEIKDWMQGLVAGVEYLHDRGLIHRDLKPANVYRENGVVKIGDVGLSKRFDGSRHQHTESIGTVYYMAPEITHGKYGPAVDVYSLGIILYELLTGKLPFNGETSGEILMKQLSAAPDLAAVPANLRPVLAHALEKDPQKRTPSARQLWNEFERALSSPTPIPIQIPETHFVNFDDVYVASEEARRDTGRSGDTDRKPAAKKPDRPKSLAYEMGRAYGAVTSPVRKGAREAPKPPGPYARRHFWEYRLIVALAVIVSLFIPWHSMTTEARAMAAMHIAFWGGLFTLMFWIREYWRPDHEPPWRLPFLSRLRPSPPLDWPGTLAIGGLAAGVFSLVIQLIVAQNLWRHQQMINRPDTMVFFTAVAIIGTWAVIGCRALTEKFPWAARHPRLLHLGAGVAVATAAVWLGDYLLIEIGPNGLGLRAAFDHLGANPLYGNNQGKPYWLGYGVFFGGVFWLLGKRFHRMQDPRRKSRWSIWSVVVAVLIAWLWAQVFVFPTLLGLYWTAAIAASVQLAAPWQPASSSLARR